MNINIDGSQVTAFAARLRGVPAELRTGLRRAIKAESQGLVRQIQGNAGWSTRIPGAVKTRVGFGQRSAGVQVYVDAGAAPHARPLEFGNVSSSINRHPVYGGPAFVDQPTRPFFMRAVQSRGPQVVKAVEQAIDEALSGL